MQLALAKMKYEMEKSSLKLNRIKISMAPQNYKNYIVFRRPLVVVSSS